MSGEGSLRTPAWAKHCLEGSYRMEVVSSSGDSTDSSCSEAPRQGDGEESKPAESQHWLVRCHTQGRSTAGVELTMAGEELSETAWGTTSLSTLEDG